GVLGDEQPSVEQAVLGDLRLTPDYQEMVLRFYRTAVANSAAERGKRDGVRVPADRTRRNTSKTGKSKGSK
ncbi:MAG TPA: hypothetical protein VFH70_03185, partial [Acidimicrobiales bacterium]|nr:hypothetical protein [Acidimicrobiales bacterium]